MATAVLPTPVGPKMATIDAHGRGVSSDGHGRPHRRRPLDRRPTRARARSRRPPRPRAALNGRPCDLAVVFASGAHLAAPEATLEAVHEALAPDDARRLRRRRRDRRRAARSRTAPRSRSGPPRWARARRSPFHATVEELEEGSGALSGLPGPRRRRRRDPARRPVLVPHRRGAALPRARRRRCCRCWAGWPRRGPPSDGAGAVPRRGGASTAARSACGSTASRCSPASPRAPRRSGRS